MKLRLSDPVIISRGPTYEEAGWGAYQFPDLFRLPDGRILCAFADSSDTIDAYGAERGCYVSADNGATWERARERDFDSVVGLLLDNGDRVQFIEQNTVVVTEDMELPEVAFRRRKSRYYRAAELDEKICNKTWLLHRVSKEHPEGREEQVKLQWPGMLVRAVDNSLVPPQPWGRLRKAPNGDLWMCTFAVDCHPVTGTFDPYAALHLFRSTDYGKSWQRMHYLPFDPAKSDDPNAYDHEGYNECDITFAPDGSYVCVVRTNGGGKIKYGPTFLIRSTDQGVTWSEPVKFDDRGVWPRLCTLKCGVTLSSYGRPGFRIRATSDPACLQWEDPVELIHVEKDADLLRDTCGYSDLLPMDDHTAGLIYTDFRIPDENGVERKTILFRTVTVEQ